MPRDAFSHVDCWIFDLDNTLYSPQARLFDQIERKMTDFVARLLKVDHDHASFLRDHYWQTHGTTLNGLMTDHGMDPGPFLDQVHDIDLGHLADDPGLRRAITALPGRKIIFTNGPQRHADRVTRARGLDGLFDAVYGIEDTGYRPKPHREAFDRIIAQDGLAAPQAAMFEDDARNLQVPHAMGMKTVLVGPQMDGAHIHHQTEDLTDFLSRLV